MKWYSRARSPNELNEVLNCRRFVAGACGKADGRDWQIAPQWEEDDALRPEMAHTGRHDCYTERGGNEVHRR